MVKIVVADIFKNASTEDRGKVLKHNILRMMKYARGV